jgi:hypothetical protein
MLRTTNAAGRIRDESLMNLGGRGKYISKLVWYFGHKSWSGLAERCWRKRRKGQRGRSQVLHRPPAVLPPTKGRGGSPCVADTYHHYFYLLTKLPSQMSLKVVLWSRKKLPYIQKI